MKKSVLFLLLILGLNSRATTIVVTNTNNTGAGSLRDAFTLAVNGDTIRFSPSLLTAGADTINLSTEIATSKNLVIKGLYTSSDTLFISGRNSNRIFNLQGASYTLDSLVLLKGRATNGGAIYLSTVGTTAHLSNSVIRNCAATQKGGAINFYNGSLYMYNCSIKNNSSTQEGGGLFYQSGGYLEIDRSLISSNSSGSFGAALCMKGSSNSECYIYRSALNNNTASSDGAALYYEGRYATLDSVTAKNNTSGGLYSGTVCFDLRFSIVRVQPTLTNCTIGDNSGVGIAVNVVPNVSTDCESVMTVSYCTIHNNTRGGIYSVVIADNANSNNQMNIDNSTIVSNGNPTNAYAGGVYAFASALGSGFSYTSQVRLVNSTIVNNSTNFDGSGVYSKGKLAGTSQVFVKSSIVAFNTGGTGRNIFSFSNATGVQSQSYNIFSEPTVLGSTANDYTGVTAAQLNLGTLGYNGGIAATMMPLTGSLAIDHGNPADMAVAENGPVQGGRRDIGAAEYIACTRQHAYTTAICQGDSMLFGGSYIKTAGVYRDTLLAGSCDSIVTFTLAMKQPSAHSITQAACGSITINSQTYTSSGTYTQHFINAAGCDSTLTLHLTINQPSPATLTQTSCDTYTLNTQTYTASGVYTQTLTAVGGCDSILTLNLTITHPTAHAITATACDSYTLNAQTYTASGTYTQTLTNAAGCDSIITLNLSITSSTAYTITATACDSYMLNAQTYTTSGIYTQTLVNAAGCDSVLTLNLTVTHPTAHTITATACESYTLNAQIYTSSGTYTQVLTNTAGCDSMITLNLTIQTIDNNVTQNETVLTANESGATYQWLDCGNGGQPVPGATAQTFTATANGSYAVVITKSTCSDTSACTTVNSVGLESREAPAFSVYPNPSDGIFVVSYSGPIESIAVTDPAGRIVLNQAPGEKSTGLDLQGFSEGVYFLVIRFAGQHQVMRKIVLSR